MKLPPKSLTPTLILTAAVGLAAVLLWLTRPSDPLWGLVEPITMVDAISWDNGGSRGLIFKDARGRLHHACLMDDLCGNQNLITGSFTPIHDKHRLRNWPVGGSRERAFLKLLERWAARDPDSRLLDRRLDLYEKGEMDIDSLWASLSAEQTIKAMAVGILRSLRQRN